MTEAQVETARGPVPVTELKTVLMHEHVFLPALRQAGVTQRQIDTMLIDNPRRYFIPHRQN